MERSLADFFCPALTSLVGCAPLYNNTHCNLYMLPTCLQVTITISKDLYVSTDYNKQHYAVECHHY